MKWLFSFNSFVKLSLYNKIHLKHSIYTDLDTARSYCVYQLFLPWNFTKEIQEMVIFLCLFDLILYIPSTIFQLCRDGSSWVEPVLS